MIFRCFNSDKKLKARKAYARLERRAKRVARKRSERRNGATSETAESWAFFPGVLKARKILAAQGKLHPEIQIRFLFS